MTEADVTIAALRTGHDRLAALVSGLGDDDLAKPSGAAEWDVAQVLSHIGSGAEIGLATLVAALDGKPNPGRDFNLSVWDRWNAMSRREQADGFLRADTELVERFEGLDADTREHLRIDLGYLPAPVDVATAARMRLTELTLHSWDVHVAFDEAATLEPEATGPLLRATGDLLGWIAKPDRLGGTRAVLRVVTTGPAAEFALRLGDPVSIDGEVPGDTDGTLTLPAEAWLRLTAGRLAPRYTPGTVEATGAADLDVLRRVFPGY